VPNLLARVTSRIIATRFCSLIGVGAVATDDVIIISETLEIFPRGRRCESSLAILSLRCGEVTFNDPQRPHKVFLIGPRKIATKLQTV
jgi:hypothetical protein